MGEEKDDTLGAGEAYGALAACWTDPWLEIEDRSVGLGSPIGA